MAKSNRYVNHTFIKYNNSGEYSVPHRLKLPAVIYFDGDMQWYHDGKIHRDNKPSSIYSDGSFSFHREGKFIKYA